MSELQEERSHTKIATLLPLSKERALPVVQEESSIEEVIRAMIRSEHSRVLYVVGERGQLTGTISLGTLVRHVFARRHDPQIHPRALIGVITAETARDIMWNRPIFAVADEEVGTVVNKMIESNVKEIPILDEEKKVIGDLTMIDLLTFLTTATEE